MRIGRRNLLLTKKPQGGERDIRNFGLLFAVVSALAGAFMVWKGSRGVFIPFGLSGVFLFAGLFVPAVLRPFYVVWMRFASMLAWINTRVLLSIAFYLVLTPIGRVLRWVGKDPLDRVIDRSAATYWVKRESVKKEKQSYEHLF